MHTFTIGGETYLPLNNSLFRVTGEIKCIEDLKEDQFYLHEGNVGTFELDGGSLSYSSFDAIFHPQGQPNYKQYYTISDTGNLGDDFTSAQLVEKLVPDQLAECPNCGSGAGNKDDEDSPTCLNCGYGMEVD